VSDAAAFIQVLQAGLNLVELPALRFDECGNGFSSKKRLGATDAPGEHFELLLGMGVDANGEGCGHLWQPVYDVYNLPHVRPESSAGGRSDANPHGHALTALAGGDTIAGQTIQDVRIENPLV
jgi:hypothetical protein